MGAQQGARTGEKYNGGGKKGKEGGKRTEWKRGGELRVRHQGDLDQEGEDRGEERNRRKTVTWSRELEQVWEYKGVRGASKGRGVTGTSRDSEGYIAERNEIANMKDVMGENEEEKIDAEGPDATDSLVHGNAGIDAEAPVQHEGPLMFDLVHNDCETDAAEYDDEGRAVRCLRMRSLAARGA